MSLSPAVIIGIIIVYMLVLFCISWLTGKDSSNSAFFLGKKESPWYVVAFGMIGASLSGVTFISIPGVIGNFSSVNGQFSYMQIALGYMVGYAVIALVLMPMYYRLNLTSIYTYLEKRFGTWSYKTGAAFFLLSRTIGASFRLFLVALVLQQFVFDELGVHFVVNVLFTLLLIWLYTLKGGIRTIVWTDTLQTTFMLLAVFATLYWIGKDLGWGISGMVSAVADSDYSKMFFGDVAQDKFFLKQFMSGAFIAICMTGLDQDMMQKNNSCKNIGEAQLNMFSFSVVLFFVNLLFVSLGALLYLYAEAKGFMLVPARTDHMFPTMAIEYFPPFIGVVFLIGLIAAAYSSADSALTALTTSFCIDFLGFEKKALTGTSDKELENTRYKVHIGFTILVLLVIIIFNYVLEREVISSLFMVATYTYGPLLGLYAFGLFIKDRQIRDSILVPIICIAAPLTGYLLNTYTPINLGFAVLLLNGMLTFAGLWAISEKATVERL